VRREDARASGRDRSYGQDRGGSGYGQPDYSRPALPSASSEPSWNDSWEEPVQQSRGHRYRDDDDGQGRGGRRFDFEVSDERWR
jgi:hypothetical protein